MIEFVNSGEASKVSPKTAKDVSKLYSENNEGTYFIIYTKPNCSKCRLTYNALRSGNNKYSAIKLLGENPSEVEQLYYDEKLSEFKSKGFRSFPVVEVYKDGKVVHEWCDFNYRNIKKYIK